MQMTSRSIAIGAAVGLTISASVASADVVNKYDFSGTLSHPYFGTSTVTGSFTLDQTNATIPSYSIQAPQFLYTPKNSFANVFEFTPAYSPKEDFVELSFSPGPDAFVALYFQTDLSTFSGDSFYTQEFSPTSITQGQSATSSFDINNPLGFHIGSTFSSGAATFVGTATPEPSTWLMMLVGFVGIGFVARRRPNVWPNTVTAIERIPMAQNPVFRNNCF
jgi:hypothetical protein